MPAASALVFNRLVNAPPAEAFRAFTHATALRDWLCTAAQVEARPGGRLYLWWAEGTAVSGRFTKVEPGHRLAGAWESARTPGPVTFQAAFKAKKSGTAVTVTLAGFGAGAKWRAARAQWTAVWEFGLENLASVVETGIDLRLARRPRLGIFIGEFSPAIAQQLGVPVKAGVRLEGTAEATGARAAGLQKDDVLIALNGKKLASPESFGAALQGLRAGDRPKVVFYRGAQKQTVPLELSRFPIADLPATGAELAAQVRRLHKQVDAALAQAVAGLTEAQAERRPAAPEWSAKELIAHFILTERDYQSWAADMLNDAPVNDDLQFRPNVDIRVAALVARLGSVAALRKELTRAEAETAALLEALPAAFVNGRKHLYRRLAQWALEVTPGHWNDEHAEQMRRTVTAAQAAG